MLRCPGSAILATPPKVKQSEMETIKIVQVQRALDHTKMRLDAVMAAVSLIFHSSLV